VLIPTYEGHGFAVWDDFLSKEDHRLVWNYIQSETLEFVHQKKWVKAFRLTDGEPLWGPPFLSDPYTPDIKSVVYPTKKGIDLFIFELKNLAPHIFTLKVQDYLGIGIMKTVHKVLLFIMHTRNGTLNGVGNF